MTIQVSVALATLASFAAKYPEATVNYYSMGLKTEIGDVTINSPCTIGTVVPGTAPELVVTGEAQPAATRKKRGAATTAMAAAASTANTTTESELFGNATGAAASTAQAATTAAATTKNPAGAQTQAAATVVDEDLFGGAAPAAEKAKEYTEQDVRLALTEFMNAMGHKDHSISLLKKHTKDGNATIGTLPPEKYGAVIAEAYDLRRAAGK